MKAETRDFMMERIAVSLGALEAFSITVRARMFAEGAGDSRARMRDSSDARVRMSVNLRGLRSLMARLTITAGSWL
jgi:hypothetical protein